MIALQGTFQISHVFGEIYCLPFLTNMQFDHKEYDYIELARMANNLYCQFRDNKYSKNNFNIYIQ